MTRLQAERKSRGLSQTALAARAKRLGTSEISRFERGMAIPYPAQAARIAKVLGLQPEELLEPATEPLPERRDHRATVQTVVRGGRRTARAASA